MNSSGRKKKCILAVLALSLLFSGCTLMPAEEEELAPPIKEPQKVTYQTIEVKEGTIEKSIRDVGKFVSVSRSDSFFKYSGGRLNKLYVNYGDSVKKGDLIADLETEDIENRIEMTKLDVRKAQLIYDRAVKQAGNNGSGNYEAELAEIDLQKAKINLESLNKELEKSRLYADISGTVTYMSSIKQGDRVNAYSVVATIADPKDLQLLYTGNQTWQFKNGMKVDVEIKDTHYSGKVVFTPSDAPADADDETKKSVRIKVDNLPDSVEMGSNANLSLTLAKKDNVIVLPNQVINGSLGRKYVNVLVSDVREERDVETGLTTETQTEIVKGLEVGDIVIER